MTVCTCEIVEVDGKQILLITPKLDNRLKSPDIDNAIIIPITVEKVHELRILEYKRYQHDENKR